MQNQTLQPGFFPGFFDPDGRMWSSFSHDYQKYQAGLEAALKIALLTQHKMNIPSGYLLDNPFLQRIFVKNKGEQTEAKCFRALMRDLLWIGMNQSNFVEEIEDWQAVLRNWIKGEGTKRDRYVSILMKSVLPLHQTMSHYRGHYQKLVLRTSGKFVLGKTHLRFMTISTLCTMRPEKKTWKTIALQ